MGCDYINVRMHDKSYKNVVLNATTQENEYNTMNLRHLTIRNLRGVFVF
jgi:hypothetical protein